MLYAHQAGRYLRSAKSCRTTKLGQVLKEGPYRVGLVVRVSASHTIGNEFASRPGHTKDHKNGTCKLPTCMARNALW